MPSVRKHMPADERRSITVEAVIDLAASQNPTDITTAAIAGHMNVTQGALFRHFPNKEAIWQAVVEWVAEHLLSRIDKAVGQADGALQSLEVMFMTHITFVANHPGVPRMLFGELQRAEDTPAKRMVRTLMQKYGERVVGLIEQGKKEGLIDAELDTVAAATLFRGSIQGLVIQSLLADDIENICKKAPGVFAIYQRGIESRL